MKKLIISGLAALALGLAMAPPAQAAVNQDTVALFTAWVNYEAERWGTGPIHVVVEDLDDPECGSATPTEVSIYNLLVS